MRPHFGLMFVLLALIAIGPTSRLEAAVAATDTVITLRGEMCGGCIKRITARLTKLADVDKVQCEVKAKTVTVTPKQDKTLSPRALWEALESIGKRPQQLVGPSGTFTSKPKK